MSKEIKPINHEKQVLTQIFQGPLPPPNILEEFERIKPGTAQEIIEMASREQEHQIFMEKSKINYANKNLIFNFILGLIGQIGTIVITLVGFFMAFLYIKAGEATLGYLVALISTAISGYLIWWKVRSNSQQENKTKKKKKQK